MRKREFPVLNKIKGRMRELGVTYQDVAGALEISVSSLGNKLNGHTDLRANEIEKLITILNIPEDEVVIYFFPEMLRSVS